MRSKKYEKLLEEYNKNPNHCLYCGKPILCSDNNQLSVIEKKKFCDSSCAASFNNRGIVRNKNGNVENFQKYNDSINLLIKYSDEEIFDIYNASNTIREFSQKLGYKKNIDWRSKGVSERLNKLGLDFTKFKIKKSKNSFKKVCSERRCQKCGNSIYNDNKSGYCQNCYREIKDNEKIEKWLNTGDTGCKVGSNLRNCIRDYIYEKQNYKCSICGVSNIWNDKELKFVLDHIDGDASNNKEDNLRLICPNCDSQLDTFKSKNKNSARNFRHKYYEQYNNIA